HEPKRMSHLMREHRAREVHDRADRTLYLRRSERWNEGGVGRRHRHETGRVDQGRGVRDVVPGHATAYLPGRRDMAVLRRNCMIHARAGVDAERAEDVPEQRILRRRWFGIVALLR